MTVRVRRRAAAALLALSLGGVLGGGAGGPAPLVLRGDLGVHDPTALHLPGGWIALGTGIEGVDGGALRLKTSPDGLTWTDAGALDLGAPARAARALPAAPPNLWAPHLFRRGGTTFLYYAASTFGKNTSAIGLLTNARLDPRRPGAGWVDRGVVLTSGPGDGFNAIDPARIDTPDGRAWLAFGSFWDGIRLRELDPASGLPLAARPSAFRLASRGGGAVEAASILEHAGRYYLFVSFDRCCAGADSTYRVMVGRAGRVTGPYVDREGVPMLRGGGSQLLATRGRLVGPGGQEALHDGARDLLVYHAYDADAGGAPRLVIAPLRWTPDGWPEPVPPPEGGTP